MNLANICAAIAATGQTVADIKTAFSRSPAKLDSVELPALIALSGAAVYPDMATFSDSFVERREFKAQVAVAPVGQKKSAADIESEAEALLTELVDVYAGAPSLGDEGVTAQVLSDTGVIALASFDNQYIGFEVRLLVSETRLRAYLTGE